MPDKEKETLKKLHVVLVEILDEFVRVCEENNFTYFLTAGTLLGAVRHKGFIPWDDDIDVAMPRKDYEKMLNYYKNNNCSNYYLFSRINTSNSRCINEAFAKICKKNTLVARVNYKKENYSGIWIDIWPFDNCYKPLVFFQTKIIKFLNKIYLNKNSIHSLNKKNKSHAIKTAFSFIPEKFIDYLLRYLYIIFNNRTTRYISFFCAKYGHIRETHKLIELFSLRKVLFNNKYYDAPNDYDSFLKTKYGNYMEIPSEDNRDNHPHEYVIFRNEEK